MKMSPLLGLQVIGQKCTRLILRFSVTKIRKKDMKLLIHNHKTLDN